MRLRRTLIALFCVALVAGLQASAATAAGRGPALRGVTLVGIEPTTPTSDIDGQLLVIHRTRANMARLAIQWSALEPDRAGQIDARYLKVLDHTVAVAAQRGLKLAVVVSSSPCWASAAPPQERGGCASGAERYRASRYPPSNPADFARIAAFITSRWGSRLAAFEVWNEPDQSNELYFAGPDKVARYAALLRAAYPAIKRADARVPVLGGAFVGKDGRWLKALYAAGIKGSYDVLSVHFYDLVLDALKDVHALQLANGDTKPLWLGEFGWTSCAPRLKVQDGHVCVGRGAQATNLLDTMRALKTVSYLRGVMVYTVRDTSHYDFGLLDSAMRLKPAFGAVRRGFSSRPGRPRSIRLRLARSAGRVVASGSGPAAGAYELDVFQGRTLRYRVAFRTDRANRFRVVLPPQLGTRGLTVQVFQYFLRRPTTRRI
jgi:hypothetical protein